MSADKEKDFKYDGTKSSWPKFDRLLRSRLNMIGAGSIIYPGDGLNAVRWTKQDNPALSPFAYAAQVAMWTQVNEANKEFNARELDGKKELFKLLAEDIQQDLGPISTLAGMYDYLSDKYQPKRDANNNWRESDVAAIKAISRKPMAYEEKFKTVFDNVVRQNALLDFTPANHPFEITADLRAACYPPGVTWHRMHSHWENAKRNMYEGTALWEYLEKCDGNDHIEIQKGSGPKDPGSSTNKTSTTSSTSSTTTYDTDLANMMPVGSGGRGGRGGRGRDNQSSGCGGRAQFAGRNPQYDTQQQTGSDKYHNRRYSNYHNHNQPYNTYNNSGRGYNSFEGRFGSARGPGRGRGRDNNNTQQRRLEQLEAENKRMKKELQQKKKE